MSTGPIATATIKVIPDTTGFKAALEAQILAATKGISLTAGAGAGAALSGLGGGGRGGGGVARKTASELAAVKTESNALRGSLIGLSRVTPVTVFGLGAAGTAAIAVGTGIKRAIASTADFEHQLNVFAATTGATAAEMVKIHDLALALGKDLTLPSTSAGDAARAMTELGKAGLSITATMAGARGVLQLAAAAQIDVGSAATFVATELNAFGLAGSQATHVADLLAGASIAAQGDIRDFGTAFQQVSAVSRQVGLSIEVTTGALTELAKAGLKGADGGTSLRTTLLRLAPTTKQAAQYMEALGIKIDKTKTIGAQLPDLIDQYRLALTALNPVQQQQALAQIFGQDAIRAASILIRGGSEALRENTRAADQNGAAQRLAEANAKGLSGAYNGLKSNLDTLGITIGEFVKGPLTDLINGLSSAVGAAISLVDAIASLGGLKVGGFDLGGAFKDAGKQLATGLVPGVGPFLQIKNLISGADSSPSGVVNTIDPGRKGARSGNQGSSGDTRKVLSAAEKARIRARTEALNERRKRNRENADTTASNKLQIALANAQIKGDLNAELVADKNIEAYFKDRLTLAKKGTKRYRDILNAEASAHSATQSIQSQIDASAKSARDKQISDAKKAAADAAATATALFNLQKSKLDLRIQEAGLTKGIGDDIRANRAEIRFYNAQIKRIEALKKRRKLTLDEQQALVDYKSAVVSLRATIKGLKDNTSASGGFTLEDLFRESISQLDQFGSNVSIGVTTGGGARAAIAGAINSVNPNLSAADRKKLAATTETNALLQDILDEIQNGNSLVVPKGRKCNVRDEAIGARLSHGPGLAAWTARTMPGGS